MQQERVRALQGRRWQRGTDLVRQEKVLSRSYFEATHPHRRLRFSHIMLRTTHYLSLARQEARNEKNHCLTLAASCHHSGQSDVT